MCEPPHHVYNAINVNAIYDFAEMRISANYLRLKDAELAGKAEVTKLQARAGSHAQE